MRQAVYDAANFWLDKGVGGFRIDAITYIKKPADFEKAKGQTVEVRLYKAVDGAKSFTGELVGLIDGQVVILTGGAERAFPQKAVAQVAPVIELDEEAIDAALEGVFDLDEDAVENGEEAEDDPGEA